MGTEAPNMGTPFKLDLSISDPQLEELIKTVAENIARGQSLPESISPYVLAKAATLALSRQDLLTGSFQYNNSHPREKVVFLKSSPDELTKTAELTSKGVRGLFPYVGSLRFGNDAFFGISQIAGSSVNLNTIKLIDKKPTEYYGTFNILEDAAKILAQIHQAGFIHKNFIVSNLVLNSEVGFSHLALYNNSQVAPIENIDQGQMDIDSFVRSLYLNSSEYPHEDHNNYFQSKYREFLK